MKKYFIAFMLLSSVTFACNNKDYNTKELPDCIQTYIDLSSKQPFETVKVQKVDGECYYWLNTGAMNWDGVEYIVNENCDTVCGYCGECIPPECLDDFDYNNWDIIWEP